jgi:HPt (histidine-containing phosphotransfer) domain-containing protein
MTTFINIEEGLLRLGGNAAIYKTLLKKFISNPYYEELCANVADNNLEEAKHNAHTIKGTAGNLSLTALFNIAVALDSALKEGSDIQSLFEEFKSTYEETIAEVDGYVNNS